MKTFRSLSLIIILIVVLLVLVVVRSSNKNLFKKDAKTAIEFAEKNQVSLSQYESQKKDYLVVDLSSDETVSTTNFSNSVHIPFAKLLDEISLETIKKSSSKILLVANEPAITEKAWVILNQLNFKNVFILSSEENAEVLKYKFQPDTKVRLE